MVSINKFRALEKSYINELEHLIAFHSGKFVLVEEEYIFQIYNSIDKINKYLSKKYPEYACGPTYFIEKIPSQLPSNHKKRAPLLSSNVYIDPNLIEK